VNAQLQDFRNLCEAELPPQFGAVAPTDDRDRQQGQQVHRLCQDRVRQKERRHLASDVQGGLHTGSGRSDKDRDIAPLVQRHPGRNRDASHRLLQRQRSHCRLRSHPYRASHGQDGAGAPRNQAQLGRSDASSLTSFPTTFRRRRLPIGPSGEGSFSFWIEGYRNSFSKELTRSSFVGYSSIRFHPSFLASLLLR